MTEGSEEVQMRRVARRLFGFGTRGANGERARGGSREEGWGAGYGQG